ncbi:GRIPAP1 (predicted), partial [Pycnogonum litorale]
DKINADMASSLSDEEFQRLQTQLIDLRTRNYSLEETAKKCNNEMKILYERISHLEQELNRSNKIINKSKQVKQVESFILENESLQHKLQSQEDEFRLQNSTIIQELSLMIATNEKLEKQLKDSGKVVKKEENDSIEDDTELRKLRAENNILKKNLNDSHAKQEIQISELNEKLSSVNVGKSTAKNDICRTSESSLSSCECNSKNLRDELKEVEMKLEILTEENRIIVEELESFKLCAKAESDDLQEEVKKLNDKVKKKQESLIQLQQEKEKMYHRNINANEEITSLKDQEISQLKDMICRLQSQLNKSLEALEDHKNKSSKSTRQLEAKINEQLCQIEDLNRSDPEKVRLLEEEAVKLRSAAETAWIERDNQIRALKDSLAHGEILKQTVHQLENIKEEAERNASEANKLAEKRKSLLDQMAIHLQKTTDELNEEIRQQKSALTEKIRDLESALISEQKKCHKLEKYKEKVENLNAQIRSLESSKAQLEDRLEDSKNRMDEVQCSHVADVNDVRDRHSKQINDLTERRNEEVKDLNIQIELIKVQKTEFEELVLKLKQEAKDAVEDR